MREPAGLQAHKRARSTVQRATVEVRPREAASTLSMYGLATKHGPSRYIVAVCTPAFRSTTRRYTLIAGLGRAVPQSRGHRSRDLLTVWAIHYSLTKGQVVR